MNNELIFCVDWNGNAESHRTNVDKFAKAFAADYRYMARILLLDGTPTAAAFKENKSTLSSDQRRAVEFAQENISE